MYAHTVRVLLEGGGRVIWAKAGLKLMLSSPRLIRRALDVSITPVDAFATTAMMKGLDQTQRIWQTNWYCQDYSFNCKPFEKDPDIEYVYDDQQSDLHFFEGLIQLIK